MIGLQVQLLQRPRAQSYTQPSLIGFKLQRRATGPMLRLGLLSPPKLRPLLRVASSTSCTTTQSQRPLTTQSSSQLHRTRPSTRSSRRSLSQPLSSTMHTVLQGDWSMADIMSPEFRSADFSEDAPQILVATQLRHAWRYDPTSSSSDSSVGVFMRDNHRRTPEEMATVPVYPDKEAVHTPWRDEVYETWNHVFYDVMRSLGEVNCGFGHFHPPKHDVFALSFPLSDGQETENTRVLTKTWDTGILLIPAHLEPGVVVRLETFSQREEDGEKKDVEKIRGRFSKDNAGEIWYLRKGVEARFFIEGEWDKSSKGLAAVMVHAILCDGKDCPGQAS